MLQKFIVANWKMNKTIREAVNFLSQFIPSVEGTKDREIGIAPTFLCIETVGKALKNTNIKLCAQNVFYENKGAYTGEVSPSMLKDAEVEYVIIGHSERRKYFHETDEIINKKVQASLKEKLKIILCIGETLEERKLEKTKEILETQIKGGLKNIEHVEALTIAYEPVWAIGTGVVATEEQIKESHLFIREKLRDIYGEIANEIRILYGGSVSPENIKSIITLDNVDGVLVGGASLDPLSFAKIVKYDQK
ncbi:MULTISPECIES: triose-phosphate isomerase [Thermodesulfovibrio]|jgi:triosephosphate isomerase|uniref:triose-phosphate isomerase n=1 Tax=Thermodesulfovibrio TaxID=28261 RepID=UPI00261B863F|nr:triose-phosphate isomerase [Thermodesulfovibrio sp.]